MCNACGFQCCGSDMFGGCGCDGCDCEECWSQDEDRDEDGYDAVTAAVVADMLDQGVGVGIVGADGHMQRVPPEEFWLPHSDDK